MAALFDSLPIFGRVWECNTAENPREEQRIAAPGVNGTGSLDMGDRGRITTIRGLHYGFPLANFLFSQEALRSYRDGRPYDFVDTAGRTWYFVKLHRFVPHGKIMLDATYGFLQHYECELQHLGSP